MKKRHYDADGRGEYFPGAAECGADRNSYGTSNLWKTEDPKKVPCARCKRTKAYREAVEKEKKS